MIERVTYTLNGQPVAIRVSGHPDASQNGTFYLHTDHLGSHTVQTNRATGQKVGASEARFYPFGGYRTAPAEPLAGRGYTGHRHNDDLGLIYMNARYYVPGIGRFASADTIVPDPANPQSFNRYSYVENNPLNYTDPTGHWACKTENQNDRCVEWISDLLSMLKNEGGNLGRGIYDWFKEYDQKLMDAGGEGIIFEVDNYRLFPMRTKAELGKIQIAEDYFYEGVDYQKAALLGHELTHIYQGFALATNKMGEFSAYYVQSELLREFNSDKYKNSFDVIHTTVEKGISGRSFSANELDDLEEALYSLNVAYYVVPRYPPLIGFNGHSSDYDLVVEPYHFFRSFNLSSNNLARGAR